MSEVKWVVVCHRKPPPDAPPVPARHPLLPVFCAGPFDNYDQARARWFKAIGNPENFVTMFCKLNDTSRLEMD